MAKELSVCERCGGDNDVAMIYVNDEPKTYCQKCRGEMFGKKNPVGRPLIGVTKKVSLTLTEDEWLEFDEKADGNRSGFLRKIVWNALGNESEWDNYACLGYAILGAQNRGMSQEQISQLVKTIRGEFDLKSVAQANEIYAKSDY